MKLAEIAARISDHLKRFESDPAISHRTWVGADGKERRSAHYWNTNAWAAGSRVGVRYVSYQGETFLKKVEATEYLAWLDAGEVGDYWTLKRKREKPA